MILPRRLVPKSRISICSPVCWQALAWRFWKHSGELRGDLIIKRLARLIRCNLDVISSARELKLVDRSRTQGRRQLNGETVTRLIPIRSQSGERRVAPEVPGRTPVRPGLICIFDQQVHLLRNVDVAANTVLPGLDRLQQRRKPLG